MSVVNLNDMSGMVENRLGFKGNSVYAVWRYNLYCVFSYGAHFPMYVFDSTSFVYDEHGNPIRKGVWLGNTDKYSPTTSRHQNKCRPRTVDKWLNTEQLKDTIEQGSYIKHIIYRGEPLVA